MRTIYLDGSLKSPEETVSIFSDFERSSGLKINYEKINIFPLRPITYQKPHFLNNFNFNFTLAPITLLGIVFDNSRENLFRLNFLPKLSRLKSLLNIWSQRDMTPIGKITIVKTIGLYQFIYLFQTLPNPPNPFIKEIESCIFSFIWSGNNDKVKRSLVIAPISKGGGL